MGGYGKEEALVVAVFQSLVYPFPFCNEVVLRMVQMLKGKELGWTVKPLDSFPLPLICSRNHPTGKERRELASRRANERQKKITLGLYGWALTILYNESLKAVPWSLSKEQSVFCENWCRWGRGGLSCL